MSGKGHNSFGKQKLREYFDAIEKLDEKIEALNSSKSDIYMRAKGEGFDVKVMRVVLSRRRMDQAALHERDSLIELYEGVMKGLGTKTGTKPATRARAGDASEDADE